MVASLTIALAAVCLGVFPVAAVATNAAGGDFSGSLVVGGAGGNGHLRTDNNSPADAPMMSAAEQAAKGSSASDPGDERDTKPLWELGLGGVALTQLAYPGAGVRVDRFLAIPYGIYRGPVLRADESNVGVRAFRSAQFELDVGVAAAFGSDSSEVKIREGLPKLGTLAEIGPQLKVRLGAVDPAEPIGRHRLTLELPVRGVFNVSNDFAFRGWSFEPQLVWRTRLPWGFSLRATSSLLFGTHKLNDTFYGVAPQYARAGRPAYEARAGLVSTRAGVSVGRALMPGVRLVAFLRVDHVGGAANEASPLVEDKTGWTAGLGFNWTFLKSSEPAAL